MKERINYSAKISLAAILFAMGNSIVIADDDSIIDVDDNAATFTGAWPTSTNRILYYGDDYQFANGTNSSTITAEAVYTTAPTLDVSGRYQVFVRWTTHPNRASNAQYRIYDGPADISPNGICTKDQRVNGGAWQFCSEVYLTKGSKGVVKLGNNANGVVVADGVRFVRVSVDSGDIVDGSITGVDIASNTITDVDIRDEPGIEFSSGGQHGYAGIAQCSSYSNLTSITVNAPTSGYVLVQASGTAKNHQAGTYWRVCLSASSGGTSCDGWAWIIEPSSTVNYKNEKSWSLQNVYYVTGSKTIYLKACHSEFATGNIMWNNVVGTFYPTRY